MTLVTLRGPRSPIPYLDLPCWRVSDFRPSKAAIVQYVGIYYEMAPTKYDDRLVLDLEMQ